MLKKNEGIKRTIYSNKRMTGNRKKKKKKKKQKTNLQKVLNYQMRSDHLK